MIECAGPSGLRCDDFDPFRGDDSRQCLLSTTGFGLGPGGVMFLMSCATKTRTVFRLQKFHLPPVKYWLCSVGVTFNGGIPHLAAPKP